MPNINFNDGFKEYTINNDESKKIRFNPSDFGMLGRIERATKEIEKIGKKYESIDAKSENAAALIDECDKEIREQINYIFNNDICFTLFGTSNCVSLCGGQPVYLNFMDAVLPILQKDIEEEKKKSDQKIKKYTNQVKA